MADLIDNMLSAHPDVQVVARMSDSEDLRTFVQGNHVDVLIIGQAADVAMEAAPPDAFSCCPRRIITVRNTGKTGVLWVIRPDGTPISELSASSLLSAATTSDGPIGALIWRMPG
jgi:hypothetical protein